jgi:hypothetical protein
MGPGKHFEIVLRTAVSPDLVGESDWRQNVMSHRLPDKTKALRGTYRDPKRTASLSVGTPRIAHAIPPPRDLDADLHRLWKLHMMLLVRNGRASACDLVAFDQMIRCARAVEIAEAAAMAAGPTEPGARGGEQKSSSAWRVWLMTQKQYHDWLSGFGLLPRSRSGLPFLPAPADGLHLVEG